MKLGTLLSAFACMALSMGFATPAKAEDPIKIGVYHASDRTERLRRAA